MLGLLVRTALRMDFMEDVWLMAGGAALALCCLFCTIYRCRKCRLRDCGCCKWCMRSTGIDKFDDFEMTVVVHEALFTGAKARSKTAVRITAGHQQVTTATSSKANFHESMSVFVEQGTEAVKIELMDVKEKKVLATLKLDPVKHLVESRDLGKEKVWQMKQKSKGLLNPRIRLSIALDAGEEIDKNPMLSHIDVSKETDMLLRSQMHKQERKAEVSGEESAQEMSKVQLFASGCTGNLDQFVSWGRSESVWVCVIGPPERRKNILCLYRSKLEHDKGMAPKQEIDLLKVTSVQADPARPEVFIISYVDSKRVKQHPLTFCRVDRARDVWVEVITLLITEIRVEKEAKQAKKGKM